MKKELHPKYQKAVIECACGNQMETRSSEGPVIKVELCSACHPFFTGKQKFVDTAGRVDKFRARMEAAQGKQSAKGQKQEAEHAESKDNKEVLKEIKTQITQKQAAAVEITQETSSDTEVAAAEELEISKEQESTDNQ